MARGYSGGRYHAWILGEALSAAGACVTLWTTSYPQYANDFIDYPGHDRIRCQIDAGFFHPPSGHFDWVLVVPDRGTPIDIYERWLCLAKRSDARVALLNFESPNWFNCASGTPVDPRSWSGWTLVSRYCDVIVSSAEESTRFAQEFYRKVPQGCEFLSCPPAINSCIADGVHIEEKRDQICVITRLGGSNFAHKGGYDLIEAIGPEIEGYELVFLVGISTVQEDILSALTKRANQTGVRLRFLEGADDREKFLEIKRSRCMLFLSRFEGFGYPPVEALYSGTPCIVFDLPVLREISGEGLIYVVPGDYSRLRSEIQRVLDDTTPDRDKLRSYVAHVAPFESLIDRLSTIFRPSCQTPPIRHLKLNIRLKCRWAMFFRLFRRRMSPVRRIAIRLLKSFRLNVKCNQL